MRRITNLKIAAAGLLLVALAGGGTCGTAPPGGDVVPSGGRVTIKLENQASCAVVVDLEFALIGGDIRRSTRRLAADGAESAVKLLPTLADTVSIRAIGDPSSTSATACSVRDERLLIFGRDFEDGSELTVGIQPLAPPPAPQPTFDCNANGVEDALDLSSGASRDCNTNQVPDECDIASGTSRDINGNRIPDSCEPDCNHNSVPDDWDLSTGASQDCNGNDRPDECDLADGTSHDVNGNQIPDSCEPDCNHNSVPDDWDLSTGASQDCNGNDRPDECDLTDGTSHDVNGNQIPDSCEPDCNHNSVPDDWDLSTGASQDCNGNDRPDECDLADGTSHDCNCNALLDECDIASGASFDRNANGVPDECEGCPPLDVVFVMDTSGSIRNEAASLCFAMTSATSQLAAQGVVLRASFLAIHTPNSDPLFNCLTDAVPNLLGANVPGLPPCCPAIVSPEDWGPAVAIVADRFPWQPFSRHVVIAVTDEGPMGGDPCQDPGPDRSIIEIAKAIAVDKQVSVGVILAQGEEGEAPCYTALANDISQATGGAVVESLNAANQLKAALEAIQLSCPNQTNCPGD